MTDNKLIFANPGWFLACLLLVLVIVVRYVSQARSKKLIDQMDPQRTRCRLRLRYLSQYVGRRHPAKPLGPG